MQQNFPSAIPTLTVGGQVFTDLSNLIVLNAVVSGVGAGNATFRKSNTSAGYQVPASKTFKVMAIEFDVLVAASGGFTLLYADNDVTQEAATAFTNPIYPAGTPNTINRFGTNTASVRLDFPFKFDIPTGKYPGITNFNNALQAGIRLYGYEV